MVIEKQTYMRKLENKYNNFEKERTEWTEQVDQQKYTVEKI